MRHLANEQYWDRPAGGNTGRLFLAFVGPVCADRFSNCPLDRVLTYKNLIYLLNLQFLRYPVGRKFHRNNYFARLRQICVFPFWAKIRKFKMAAICGEGKIF